jgi:hypothetical protein
LAVTTANCFGISLSKFDLLLLGDGELVIHHLLLDIFGELCNFDDLTGWVVLDKDQAAGVLGLQLPMIAFAAAFWGGNVHLDVRPDGPEKQTVFARAMLVLVDNRSIAYWYHEGSNKRELQEVLAVRVRVDLAFASPGG